MVFDLLYDVVSFRKATQYVLNAYTNKSETAPVCVCMVVVRSMYSYIETCITLFQEMNTHKATYPGEE